MLVSLPKNNREHRSKSKRWIRALQAVMLLRFCLFILAILFGKALPLEPKCMRVSDFAVQQHRFKTIQ